MFNRSTATVVLMCTVLIAAESVRAANRQATTRPGEEVMQPTKYGLRATPEIVRGFSRLFVRNANPTRDWGLTEQQQDQMAEALSRRVMESAHSKGQQWQQMIEYLMEQEMEPGHGYDAQTGAEFARRYLPLMDEMRRLIRGTLEDSKNALTADQLSMAERNELMLLKAVDGIERRMKRWEKGEIGKDRFPFEPEEDSSLTPEQREQERREEMQLEAEQRANRIVREASTELWNRFVEQTAEFFGFTDEQKQEAEQIREEYAGLVQEIATDEWKVRLKRNRMKIMALPSRKMAPYRFGIEEEYREMMAQFREVDDEFHDMVIGLATQQQRRDVLAKIETAAKRHGIQAEEMKLMESLLLHQAGVE